MNLLLIGYRGTGKTTVARRLASRLGWSWVDADELVESQVGKSIAEIFAEDGETSFRDAESRVVRQLADWDHHVVSLGGGAVLRDENRKAIAQCGPVVWLRARAATIRARLQADATTAGRRPNLTASGGLQEIVQLLAEREPLYRQCARLAVDTEDKTPDEVAEEVLQTLDLGG